MDANTINVSKITDEPTRAWAETFALPTGSVEAFQQAIVTRLAGSRNHKTTPTYVIAAANGLAQGLLRASQSGSSEGTGSRQGTAQS